MVSFNNLRETGFCLSTDQKPSDGIPDGAILAEMDTSTIYVFSARSETWQETPPGAWTFPFLVDLRTRVILSWMLASNQEPVDAELSVNGLSSITDATDGMEVNGDTLTVDIINLNKQKYNVSDDE